jgi:hypothetical protein
MVKEGGVKLQNFFGYCKSGTENTGEMILFKMHIKITGNLLSNLNPKLGNEMTHL